MEIKKILKKITVLLLVLCLIMPSAMASVGSAASKVRIDFKKITLFIGESVTLRVTKNGKKVKATWTSSMNKIASVGKKTGKVKAKKKGICTITAKYAGKKYKCKVTVVNRPGQDSYPSGDYDYPAYTPEPAYKPDNIDNTNDNVQVTDGIEIIYTGETKTVYTDENGKEEIKTAYTNGNGTEAYIYYDVIDQYGNSVRSSTKIAWNVSDSYVKDVDKSSGKITINKSGNDNGTYTDGTKIYITGVDINSGKTANWVIQINNQGGDNNNS